MSNYLFRILLLTILSTAMFVVSPLAAQSTRGSDSEASFRRLHESIFPAAGEEKWRRTPWVPSISTGVRMAQERKRPLFLWAMNGDPLGSGLCLKQWCYGPCVRFLRPACYRFYRGKFHSGDDEHQPFSAP